MAVIVSDSDSIREGLLSTLSHPPSRVGRRLQPEEVLARSLGVSVRQVRKLLNELVAEGVLVRRRGSGTYVRRLPTNKGLAKTDTIPPEVLFVANDGQTAVNGRPAKLQLGLWSDLAYMQHPNQEILAGMAQEAERLGHYLAVHSVVEQRDQPVTPEELAKRLERAPEDGYIINARWAELFDQLTTWQAGAVVYYQSGSIDVSHTPLVMFNTDETVQRAMRLLSKQNCKRIAVIGRLATQTREDAAYEVACRLVGQEYRGSQYVDFFLPSSNDAGQSLLAAAGERPDGIYVADDHLLPTLMQTMKAQGLEVGRDIAIITLSNAGVALPEEYEWSRLEFDPRQLGCALVRQLVETINRAEQPTPTQALYAEWKPGKTHQLGVDG